MPEEKEERQFTVGKILVKKGQLSVEVYEKLVAEAKKQKRSFLDLLHALRVVSEEQIIEAKAEYLEVPYVDLRGVKIKNEDLNFIAKKAAENFKMISFEKTPILVKIALVDPEDFKAIETIEFLTKRRNLKTELYITSRESFETAFKQYESLRKEVGEFIEKAEVEYAEEEAAEGLSEAAVEKVVQEAPISKAVNVILSHAIDGRASDVHIEPLEKETKVRYRVDGVLHTSLILPKKIHQAIVARIKVLSKLKIDERRLPQDGRFLIQIGPKKIDIRVSTLPVATGEKVVMRLLDRTKGALTLEELGFMGHSLEVVKKSIKEPYGMFLVTGPTGSGKSTTLYSVLDILNREGVNIITMEDPVEYRMEGINQSQIRPEIGLTFASGLRSILRQDPDIIMVGEIRDKETAEMAVHSALTGHFLLSTLHTNTAVGAIPRLVDMGVERFLLTASLNMIVGQRLIRVICEKCKAEVKLSLTAQTSVEKIAAGLPESERKKVDLKKAKFYRGKGCAHCGREGYKGRIGIFEVLEVNDSIKRAILAAKTNREILELAQKEQAMLTMEQDGILKVLAGKTSVEEVIQAA